jgi:hypothetical protein
MLDIPINTGSEDYEFFDWEEEAWEHIIVNGLDLEDC